ncbi:hypothetical protein QAD02_005900 [Eretmocerus hayati]|uniref:Uncharacterized protein n=1 Tax=Eretmocerus hayati TaxID=131215 RepID=A0ACC2MZN2_9HYME|nr:hypothetical protein QAD02_005900 [Eretmocerus hayati]
MYAEYRSLSSQKLSQSKFKKFVEDADTEELCKMVLKVLNTSEATKMLDDVLQGFSDVERSQDKKFKLMRAVFDALRKSKANGKHVDNIISRIVVEFPSLNRIQLVKLVDYSVERIRNNDDDFMSWKDIIPLLLERLEEEKSVSYRGSDVSGPEYKLSIIRSICDIDWDPNVLTALAKMFGELIADVKDKAIQETIMKALTSKLVTLDLNELPPLVHQMLKLGSSHNGVLLFSTLSKYMTKNYISALGSADSEEMTESITNTVVSLKELQEVESTVLYYIYNSAVENTKASLEYMKCLKSVVNAPEYILEPFVISVLLLLSGLHEDQAFPILKSALLRQIQDEENQKNSAWLRKISSSDLNAMDTLYRVIENSNKDRQLVLKGMVDFAFVLLGVDRKANSENPQSWDYGTKVLQRIARKRLDAGGSILEILVNKIVQGGVNVIQYTDCLAYMCRRLTMTVLDHQVWITTLMEQLLVIPGEAAAQVLRAILPLMRVSGSIRDSLIMILRKALYRKGTRTRQMSVLGFLQLLKNLKLSTLTALSQSESLSSSNLAASSSQSIFTQASIERPSQRGSSNPWQNTSLCREILAILSRCFTHEPEVRSHLYHELYFGILKNQELTEYVVEMLLEHLFEFYEKDEQVLPPLLLDKCGAIQGIEVAPQEPIADLVFAIQKIYLRVASKDSVRIDKLAVVLESLCKRMAQTDVEHLGLDDETDLLDGTPKAQQKLLNIKNAMSVYEALMAYRIASWSTDSVNTGASVIALFKGYHRLVEYLKRISKKKPGGKGKKDKAKDKDKDGNDTTTKKGGRPAAIKLPNTVMDFDTIAKSIVLLYNPSNSWSTEDQTSGVRGRFEIHIYVLTTCQQLLQNVKTLKDHDLENCLELNKQNFITIGETLFKHVISDLKTVTSFNEQAAVHSLECFRECCDIVCNTYQSALPSFLEAIGEVESSKTLNNQLQAVLSKLKDVFLESLDDEPSEEMGAQRIPFHLLEIIAKLIQKLNFADIEAEKEFKWLIETAEKRENVEVQVAALVFQLILLVLDRSVEHDEVIQDLACEFGLVLGRNDKSESTGSRRFNMLNDTNIYVIYIAVNKILSSKLQNISSVLGRLNAELTALSSLEVDDDSSRRRLKDKEQSLCRQFAFILGLFENLAAAKILPGQASDAIFKNLQKVYNLACTLTKYFRKKSTSAYPAFQSVKFIPVIQGAGNALKQTITYLILNIESSQSGGKSSDANIQRNKILKEAMVIPGVVQAMDMFDKEILLLAKKTNVDLMKYTKYDAIRDFRIKNTQFQQALENMNVSLTITQTNRNGAQNDDSNDQLDDDPDAIQEEENGNDSNSESADDDAPSKKRRKK